MNLTLIAITGPDETALTLATRHLVANHGFWTIPCNHWQSLQFLQDDIDDAKSAKPEFHITHAVVNAIHNEAQAALVRQAGGIVLHIWPDRTSITPAMQDMVFTTIGAPEALYHFLDTMVTTMAAAA